MSSGCATRRPQGFSLTELAIVISIFGMILAGLWSLVDIVQENIKRGQAADQIMITAQNVRSFYQGQTGVVVPGAATSYANVTDYLIRRNLIPDEMVVRPLTNPATATNPWFGGFSVSDDAGAGGLGAQGFRIRLQGLRQPPCATLVSRVTSPSGPPGLVRVIINGGAALVNFPILYNTALTNCGVGANTTLELVYRLRQQTR